MPRPVSDVETACNRQVVMLSGAVRSIVAAPLAIREQVRRPQPRLREELADASDLGQRAATRSASAAQHQSASSRRIGPSAPHLPALGDLEIARGNHLQARVGKDLACRIAVRLVVDLRLRVHEAFLQLVEDRLHVEPALVQGVDGFIHDGDADHGFGSRGHGHLHAVAGQDFLGVEAHCQRGRRIHDHFELQRIGGHLVVRVDDVGHHLGGRQHLLCRPEADLRAGGRFRPDGVPICEYVIVDRRIVRLEDVDSHGVPHLHRLIVRAAQVQEAVGRRVRRIDEQLRLARLAAYCRAVLCRYTEAASLGARSVSEAEPSKDSDCLSFRTERPSCE